MTQGLFTKDNFSKFKLTRSRSTGPPLAQNRIILAQPKSSVSSSVELANARKEIATILVMGRSGSGKTQFIRSICPTPEQHKAKTLEVEVCSFTLSGQDFRLVDTPGFDNIDMSDTKALTKVAQYVLHRDGFDQGITGVIFIHPAGDMFQSNTLRKNLETLLKLFLGEKELHRLTVLVTPGIIQGLDLKIAINQFRQYGSTLFKTFQKVATIEPITRHQSRPTKFLYLYSTMAPIHPPICRIDSTQLKGTIEKSLGYYEAESVNSIVTFYKQRISELHSTPQPQYPASEVSHLQQERDKIQRLYINLQNSNTTLQQQLQQIQKEHASLQSQAQTHCTYDWKAINDNLDDLNTLLKEVGQSISDHLSDRYVQETFGKKPEDVTTLDARDMPQLISWLGYDGHVARQASLISPPGGSTGLDAETFFDFSIRSQLCARLIHNIFLPFHPLLEPSENDWITDIYDGIRQQESQYMAGRWRSTTFNYITKSKSANAEGEHIARLARDFIFECLNPLVIHFFGCMPENVNWNKQYRDHVYQLFEMAYKWSARLKQEVILLGDFEQVAPVSCSKFDRRRMEDFDPSSQAGGHRARTVLATLGFGITVHEAVGGGNPPKSTILRKALVATDAYYRS
ncbi:hypothetical protein B0J17DRAFT_664879 [Rhizoctonia solani]|nr:hypothetical protein B0J17DRAFT_664879 [Rhizoctonia solani]